MNGVTTNYALDLNAALTQVLADTGTVYLYGNGRIGERQSGGWQYHHADGLGSLRSLTNASATVTLNRRYEPYGSVLETTGAASSIYGYTGEQQSGGLVYLRARNYASGLGRFLSRDPSRLERNLFVYAIADPINNVDPTGLVFWRMRTDALVSLMGRQSMYQDAKDINAYAHAWIEKWMETQNGYWNAHMEFPGGGRLSTLDAIVLDRSRVWSTDNPSWSPVVFRRRDQVTGSVFEIEPANLNAVTKGTEEINNKLADLSAGVSPFFLTGTLPASDRWPQGVGTMSTTLGRYAGTPYDWTYVSWQLGTQLSPQVGIGPTYVPVDVSGVNEGYWILLLDAGLVVYYSDRDLRNRVGDAVVDTATITLLYELLKRLSQGQSIEGLVPKRPRPQPGNSNSQEDDPALQLLPQWCQDLLVDPWEMPVGPMLP